MEKLEIQTQVINLAKLIVENLELDYSDPLSKWMACYLSEKMTLFNETQDAEIRVEIYNTVKDLWEHRDRISRLNPFQNFDGVLRALERFDPENNRTLYYLEDKNNAPSEINAWLLAAKNIDDAAKTLLDFIFSQAALDATDKQTIEWLKNSTNLEHNEDIRIIIKLISKKKLEEHEAIEKTKQEQVKSLKLKIEKLDNFISMSKDFRSILEEELKNIL